MGDNIVEQSNQPEVEDKDATVEHQFSAPWDGSDVILVVEGQEFHVHKLMLKMASPVFRTMFESDFKEKDAARIPLPGKKSPEFLDFLKLIYQITGQGEITIENIDHIYALADEYQVEPLTKACGDFLKSTEKTEENALKILILSQKYTKGDFYKKLQKDCLDALHAMAIDNLKEREEFEELSEAGLTPMLIARIEKLENDREKLMKCMKDIYPQVFGLITCLMKEYPKRDAKGNVVDPLPSCPAHPNYDTTRDMVKNIATCQSKIKCDICRSKILLMSHSTKQVYCGGTDVYHFNGTLLQCLDEMSKLF